MPKPLFSANVCQPHRVLPGGCRRCADVCSAGVLTAGSDGVTVAEGCQSCGRCAAACPAGAVSMPGMPEAETFLHDTPTAIECQRVPERLSANAVRVPCLGGLDETHLLALHLSANCRSVHLVDRGWCRDCPAGGPGAHPVANALRTAVELLTIVGTDPASMPVLQTISAPRRLRQDIAPVLPGRRTLFGRLLKGADASAAPPKAVAKRPPRRARALAMLARIQEHRGESLPGALFPEIRLSGACTNCGVCSALCPTGALVSYEADAITGLSFDAASCTVCGRCTDICREGAITLISCREGLAPEGRELLAHFEVRGCLRCETEFAGDGEERFCPRCRLDRGLFTHAPGRATTGSEPAAVQG